MFTDDMFLDIKGINIAHEFTLDRVHKCEYPSGRGVYGLVYAIEGAASFRFTGGERVAVSQGDLLFLSPYAAYSVAVEKEFRHYTVNFEIHKDTSRSGNMEGQYYLVKNENTKQTVYAFQNLVNAWESKKSGFAMRSVGYLYELLSLFWFDYKAGQDTSAYYRLIPAKEYIEKHFDKVITLEELARLSNMSVTNFRREWKKIYSETPMQYRDSVRLYYAREYLNSGYYTVSEVGEKCGFDDVSYFVRFFRKKVGISPGKFQKQSM